MSKKSGADAAAELRRALDQLKADLLRHGMAPIYRTLRLRKVAQLMLDRADELDPPTNAG